MKLSKTIALLTAVLGLAIPAAGASIVVDQSNLLHDVANSVEKFGYVPSRRYTYAQTFTVGVGGQLVGVDVGVFRPAILPFSLMVDITTVADGVVDLSEGGRLATRVIPATEVPPAAGFDGKYSLLSLDLTELGIDVTVGEQLAIVVRADNDPANFFSYVWRGAFVTAQSYPLGSPQVYDSVTGVAGPFPNFGDFDFEFRTLVAVPEGSLQSSLLIASCVFLIARRGR